MQSKSTFLEFLDGNSSLQIWLPEKFFRGKFFSCKWRHCNRPCALSVSGFPSRVGASCLFVESVDLLFAFGVLACRILDCGSLLCGLLSSKLRCLRLKIELLAFWGPACLRRKKWPTWVRFVQSLAHLLILSANTNAACFVGKRDDAFCYMTRSIIHNVHKHDLETPWLLYVNREQFHFFRCIWTTFY